jgi:Asp-tRNA(Asn)/Glu-tRNA(Gln) amidotransferase A subunit family amidase
MASDTDPAAADYKEIRAAIERSIAVMAGAGASIIDPVTIPALKELLEQTSGTFEAEESTNGYLAQHPNAPVKTLREIVMSGQVIPSRLARLIDGIGHTTDDPGFLRHLKVREELRRALLNAMAEAGLDALVYATFDHDPTRIPEDIMTASVRSQPGSNRTLSVMTGFPAVTVPAGYTAVGLPIGVELLGRPFSEGTLLKLAYAYERVTCHRQPPPTTPRL